MALPWISMIVLCYVRWTFASTVSFPINDFYGFESKPSTALIQNITFRHLCEDGMMADTGCCSCDEYCMMFKTCCINYLWEDFTVLYDTHSLDRYLIYFMNETGQSKYRDTQCIPLVNELNPGDVTQNILMVNQCPSKSKDSQIIRKCLDPGIVTPVLGSDKYVYKNSFCAICNNINEFQMVDTIAQCKTVQTSIKKDNVPKLSTCKYEAKVPFIDQDYIRECSFSVQTDQCDSSDASASISKSYGGIVKSLTEGYYSNINNLECNLTKSGVSKIDFFVDECPHSFPYIWPWSTSITINYGKVTRIFVDGKIVYIGEKQCADGSIYNVVRQNCQPFVCAPGYEVEGSACVESKKNPTAVAPTSKRPDSGDLLTEKEQLLRCVLRNGNPSFVIFLFPESKSAKKEELLLQIQTIHKDVSVNGRMIWMQKNLNEHSVSKLLNLTENYAWNDIIDKVFLRSQPFFYTNLYKDNMNNTFSNSRQCSVPVISKLDVKPCLAKSSNISTDDHLLLFQMKKNVSSGYLISCNQFHHSSDCKMKVYDNYTLHVNNSVTIDVKDKGDCPCSDTYRTYNASEYTPLNKGIGICINKLCTVSNGGRAEEIILSVDFYLSLLGAIVSIISNVFVIVTYLLFRDLRSVPGANIISLCLVLLLADGLSLAANGLDNNIRGCHVIAIMLHVFYLMVHSWSTVISFEVWSTFRLAHVKRNMYSYKRFAFYCLYAFLFPLTLVAVSVVLDKKDIIFVGYGEAGNEKIRICWLSSVLSRVIFYIAPVVLATIFNLSVLSSTISLIHKQQKIASKLLNKTNPRDGTLARTALKLAVLLGLAEIIGLIQIPGCSYVIIITNAVVRVLFTVMRGFRGLFILMLYVLFDNRTQELFTNSKEKRGSVTMSTYLSSQRASLARLSIKNNNVLHSSQNDLVNDSLNGSNSNIAAINVVAHTNESVDTTV